MESDSLILCICIRCTGNFRLRSNEYHDTERRPAAYLSFTNPGAARATGKRLKTNPVSPDLPVNDTTLESKSKKTLFYHEKLNLNCQFLFIYLSIFPPRFQRAGQKSLLRSRSRHTKTYC
jgi:hypothetical protein